MLKNRSFQCKKQSNGPQRVNLLQHCQQHFEVLLPLPQHRHHWPPEFVAEASPGEKNAPHMKTSKGLPASLWLNTATLRLRQSQQVLSPPWRATNMFAVLGLNFKSHLVGIALVHQKSLPLPTETHLDCILQEESISIRAPYYGGGWDEDMKGKPYLRDKSVEECIELVCNCALLGSQNSPQPLSLLSS